MIWGESIYTNSPKIEELLSSEEINLKELLDDEDILQECKTQNKKLVLYITRPNVIDELVDLITTEPTEDTPESLRFKYANIACEILTSDIPSLSDSLVSDEKTLMKIYEFIKQEPPLNPLLTAFFSKTFSTLISRKSSQNLFSYKSVCHQVLEFIKARDDFFDMLLKHICMPVIMDLLYHIMTQIDESDMKKNFLEYINEKRLIENLIKILSQSQETEKHYNIAQFLSEIIKTGRTTRQDESQEAANDESYPILKTLECENTSNLILETILNDHQSESSIIAGIKIILSLFENPIINEPVSDAALQYLIDTEKQHHKIVVTNLINCIIPTIKKFHEILLNPPEKSNKSDSITWITPPFGNTRLQVCCLFTVLIETENLDVLNVICEVDFFNTLLKLFKEYCWNNFLHNQVKKCLVYAFQAFDQLSNETILTPSALQKHIIEKCKIVSKLLDCWTHNEQMQSQERGRRLGYMGHLIEILDHLVTNILISEELRALVELSLNEEELVLWKKLTESENGDLVKALEVQNKYLANCNPNKHDSTFDASPSKDYISETFPGTGFNDLDANMHNTVRLANLSLQDLEQQQELFEQTCKKSFCSFPISRELWEDDNEGENLKMKFISIEPSDDMWNNVYEQMGISSGSDDSRNIWTNDIDSNNGLNTQTFNDDNWANFDANNFADFDTHFTDFDPIQTSNIILPSSNNNPNPSNNNINNNNIIDNESKLLSAIDDDDNVSSQTKPNSDIICDDKNLKMQTVKNLVPGADGRLVLATTFIPYNDDSVHSKYIAAAATVAAATTAAAAIASATLTKQETEPMSEDNPNLNDISEIESDNIRNSNETIENKNVLSLDNNDHQDAESANGELTLNGPNINSPIQSASIDRIDAAEIVETKNSESTPKQPPPILSSITSPSQNE